MSGNNSLADALSALEEDRLTPEQIAFDEAYAAAQEEDREQTRAAARRITEAKIRGFLSELVPYLPLINIDGEKRITVDGDDFIVGGWRVPGRYILSFYDFPGAVEICSSGGRRQKYRCGKNGFNFAKIAEEVGYKVASRIMSAKMEQTRERNRDASQSLRERLGVLEYSSLVRPSTNADKPVHVELKVSAAMTVEQAERVISFLREEGVLSKYEFN